MKNKSLVLVLFCFLLVGNFALLAFYIKNVAAHNVEHPSYTDSTRTSENPHVVMFNDAIHPSYADVARDLFWIAFWVVICGSCLTWFALMFIRRF